MRFLLDMGISGRVADWLILAGHDAVHLNDEKLYNLSDHLIIEKADKEQRIILTADMDFGHMLAFSKLNTITVIQFRVSDFRPDNVIEKLELLFGSFTDQLTTGYHIITVEDKKIRIRSLPI